MTSPIVLAKRAIERKLQQEFPTLKISYEGVNFKVPNSELYLICNFKVGKPTDPTLGREYYRENIACNVFVCDVLNQGTANAFEKAEQVRLAFDKGTTLVEGNTDIHVLSTPQVQGSTVAGDRLVVPVLISTVVEVARV